MASRIQVDSRTDCFALIDSLQLIRRATNINDNKSLVIHPASTIFAEYSDREKEEMEIGQATIRLSAGIEAADDIIADLDAAFATLSAQNTDFIQCHKSDQPVGAAHAPASVS